MGCREIACLEGFVIATVESPRMQRTLIRDIHGKIGGFVQVSGFVEALRDQKRMQFIVLRDPTGSIQTTHEKSASAELTSLIATLTPGSFVTVFGTVKDAPNVKLGGVEVSIESANVASIAESPQPIADDSSLEKQIDYRQLSLRSPRSELIFRIQTTLEHAMREFWFKHGFIEIHSPKLMGTASESGAEVFQVEYFERKAFLAQSPQFYKQMAMSGGFDRVFEIGPAFRAEPSFTSRHETEFTSIDMEIAWIESHEDVMRLEEEWLTYAIASVAERHDEEISKHFGVRLKVPAVPFPRVTVEQARIISAQRGHKIDHRLDLDPEGERLVSSYAKESEGHEFCFVIDYPASTRAFYHMRHTDRPDLTKGFDLLWNGIEVTTGAQREHRFDRLVENANERGYDISELREYFNFFRYGCPPHGGMGVGLARLLMAMLHVASIREVTYISRTPTRLTP